jgi:hypothetical protein
MLNLKKEPEQLIPIYAQFNTWLLQIYSRDVGEWYMVAVDGAGRVRPHFLSLANLPKTLISPGDLVS